MEFAQKEPAPSTPKTPSFDSEKWAFGVKKSAATRRYQQLRRLIEDGPPMYARHIEALSELLTNHEVLDK